MEVVSPFSDVQSAVNVKPRHRRRQLLILVAITLAIGAVAGGVLMIKTYLNDPYRTLEPFPIAKYLEGYRSLSGSRYKAEVRVEADLGWKESVGRLMLFSSAGESRPIAVLIPYGLAKEIYFTKGQTYLAELEVKEGGLIYANSCRKN